MTSTRRGGQSKRDSYNPHQFRLPRFTAERAEIAEGLFVPMRPLGRRHLLDVVPDVERLEPHIVF